MNIPVVINGKYITVLILIQEIVKSTISNLHCFLLQQFMISDNMKCLLNSLQINTYRMVQTILVI